MDKKPKVYAKGISFRDKRTKNGTEYFGMFINEKFIDFFNENKTTIKLKDGTSITGINFDLWKRDVPDKYNNTHNVVVNDYVPQQQGQQQADAASMQNFNAPAPEDDLPF